MRLYRPPLVVDYCCAANRATSTMLSARLLCTDTMLAALSIVRSDANGNDLRACHNLCV